MLWFVRPAVTSLAGMQVKDPPKQKKEKATADGDGAETGERKSRKRKEKPTGDGAETGKSPIGDGAEAGRLKKHRKSKHRKGEPVPS